jgi:hypothetical protein
MREKAKRFLVILAVVVLCVFAPLRLDRVLADAYSYLRHPVFQAITDNPTISIGGVTVDSGVTPTAGAHRAEIQWAFGTVSGTYSSCTVQAKTSLDGSNWLTLGSAASLTVSSNALNAWSVIEQLGTTSVTTSSPSSTAALSFGAQTKYTFACSGGYGTNAPVTISVLYK